VCTDDHSGAVREKLPWADLKLAKDSVDAEVSYNVCVFLLFFILFFFIFFGGGG
jgi:hypothetical protein